MKRLMVTGGAGFIGSEFVRQAVTRGFKVTMLDSLTYAGDIQRVKEAGDAVSFLRADITDKETIDGIFVTERPDAVVHWAAESHVDRSITDASPFIDTNIKGTQVLLDAAKKYGVERFINISTDEVYGELGMDGSFREDTPLNPNSPYSASKASADMLGRAYHHTHKLPVITIRPSNNYGPWQYPEKLIPVVIIKAMAGERIPVYGKGDNVREWLFVADCAGAVFSVLEKGLPGQVYNVGSGEERKNIDVVKGILEILGKSEDLIEFTTDRLGHDFRYSLDSSRIRKELSWECKTGFREGLEKTVAWYLSNNGWVEGKLKQIREYWEQAYRK